MNINEHKAFEAAEQIALQIFPVFPIRESFHYVIHTGNATIASVIK